ncbi:MAG: hypothetical protein HY943_18015 [Gammaproteobacteria bacterium]|nr:hypothetical protein [Gammaproteobacteria bacterium]
MNMNVMVTEKGPLDAKVKAHREIVNAGLSDAVRVWHKNMLPGHFVTQEAFEAKYGALIPGGFVKRGKRYSKRKAFRYGHRRNLEYSGELKRNVVTQVVISSGARKFSASARLPGSQKANFKRSAAAPNMRDELIVTTAQEDQRLAQVAEYLIAQALNANTPVVTRPVESTSVPAMPASAYAAPAGRPEV